MEKSLYLNGKPLVTPPMTLDQQLKERLQSTGINYSDVLKVNERPVLQIIDLDGLSSTYTNNNRIFQMLKQQIMDWNEKVTQHRANQIELPNGYIYDNLFRSLRSQLQEVNNCKNRQQQQLFLNKVSAWFFRQLPRSQVIKLAQSLLDQKDNTLHFIPTEYGEDAYKSALQDYTLHYRSTHPEMDPPEERVKQYQRKNLLSDTSTRPGTTPGVIGYSTITRPQTSQTTYKMIEQLDKISRPKTNQTNQQMSSNKPQQSWMYDSHFPVFETFEEQSKSTRRQMPLTRQESPLKADKPSTDRQEQFEGIEQEQEELEDDEEALSPDKQSQQNITSQQNIAQVTKKSKKNAHKYISIAPEKKTFKTDKETEQAYQIGQSARLGELQGTFHNYDPTGIDDKMAAVRLNQYYQTQRLKDLKEQREDAELIVQMKDWANNKGRINEMALQSDFLQSMGSKFTNVGIKMSDMFESKKIDIEEEQAYAKYLNKSTVPKNRMVQSAVQMTKIINNTMQPTMMEDPIIDYQLKQAFMEQKINSQKFLQLKKSRGALLPGGLTQNPDSETINNNRVMSSSCFKSAPQRQFSGVFKTFSSRVEAGKQVDELHSLKTRLASANKFVPITVLQRALVIPQGHQNPYGVPLPFPGQLLNSNPETGKKVRGKKKKTKK